jgi:hypothetical protein
MAALSVARLPAQPIQDLMVVPAGPEHPKGTAARMPAGMQWAAVRVAAMAAAKATQLMELAVLVA